MCKKILLSVLVIYNHKSLGTGTVPYLGIVCARCKF